MQHCFELNTSKSGQRVSTTECIEGYSRIIKSSLGHRHHTRSNHTVTCTSFIPLSIIIF